ncbi:hypothetical protein ABE236_18175 [Priestia endophytica]|uniref:hypothetical protein n=1 Tax=Priestia endophytica TaxID=135735 RepID=UPI003D26BD34
MNGTLKWAEHKSHKGRELYRGQKVKVYFNIHKNVFSIKDVKTGLVVGHSNEVTLEDVTFKVSQTGRERVLKERRKNVHAFVEGTLTGLQCISVNSVLLNDPDMEEAFYNPYKTETFVDRKGNPLHEASEVVLWHGQMAFDR